MKDSTNETKSKLEKKQFHIPSKFKENFTTQKEMIAALEYGGHKATATDLIAAGISNGKAYRIAAQIPQGKAELCNPPLKSLSWLKARGDLAAWLVFMIGNCDQISIGKLAKKIGLKKREVIQILKRQTAAHIVIDGYFLTEKAGKGGLYLLNGEQWAGDPKHAETRRANMAKAREKAKEVRNVDFIPHEHLEEPPQQYDITGDIEETTRRKLAENAKDRAATMEAAAKAGLDTDWIDKTLNSESLPATTAKEETAPATITSQAAAQRIETWQKEQEAKAKEAKPATKAKQADPPGLVEHNKLKAENAKSRATTDKIFGALMSTAGNDDNQLTSDQKLIVKYYREQGRPYKYALEMAKNHPELATEIKAALAKLEAKKAEKQGLEAQIKPELVSADSSYFDEPPLESYDLDYCCQGGQRWQEPENEPEPVTVAPATPKTANIYAITRQGWQPANNGWKPYFERQGGNIAAIFEATLKALEYNPDLHAAYLEQLNEQAKFGEQADQWWQGIKAKYNIKSKY